MNASGTSTVAASSTHATSTSSVNVAAGSSKLGRVADVKRFEEQALADFAPDGGNNVEIQVYPSATLGS